MFDCDSIDVRMTIHQKPAKEEIEFVLGKFKSRALDVGAKLEISEAIHDLVKSYPRIQIHRVIENDPHDEAESTETIEQLESDRLILALRLYGEDYDTFSPEAREVMDRMRPIVAAVFG